MTDWELMRSVRDFYLRALTVRQERQLRRRDVEYAARVEAEELAASYGFENPRSVVDEIVQTFGRQLEPFGLARRSRAAS